MQYIETNHKRNNNNILIIKAQNQKFQKSSVFDIYYFEFQEIDIMCRVKNNKIIKALQNKF